MNIDVCEKCLHNEIHKIYYEHKFSDREDGIYGGKLIINHEENKVFPCVVTVCMSTKINLEKLFGGYQKFGGLTTFMSFDREKIKKIMPSIDFYLFFGKSDCPYYIEHQLYDWNKK